MSQTASKTKIGAFTLGALILALLAIGIFGSGSLFRSTSRYVLFFDASVARLSIGAPVVFQGVPVGRVVDVHLSGDLERLVFRAPVYVELDLEAKTSLGMNTDDMDPESFINNLVDHGLRARLASQSLLTGQLMVELNIVPPDERNLSQEQREPYNGVSQIPTVPSTLDSIWNKFTALPIEDIANNVKAITDGLDRIVNSDHLGQALGGVNELLSQLKGVAVEMNNTLSDVRLLAGSYDKVAREAGPRISQVLEDFDKTLARVSKAADQAKSTLSEAGSVLDGDSLTMIEVKRALREVADAARAVRSLAATLERKPEALLQGKGK